MNIAIFDLDGTLINTIDDLGQACNHALEQLGFPMHAIADYPSLVGNGVNKLIRRALPENERTDQNVMRAREFFVPYYDTHNTDYTRPYDGIVELLKELKEKGYFLAVASNKYQAATEKIVDTLFPNVFDIVLGEREGIERKPHPQIVYDIMYQCADIESVVYIGDSLVDMETAANANVPFVACSWGFVPRQTLEQAGAECIIDHPASFFSNSRCFQ